MAIRRILLKGLLCALLACGCSTDGGSLDAGTDEDASTDDGSSDAGANEDGSSDGGLTEDGSSDGGTNEDGSSDGGLTEDGSADADAGPEVRPLGPRFVEPTSLSAGTLFAAPDGSGTACTEAEPCDLWTATDQAEAGDVVFLRGGVYSVLRNLYFRGRGTSPAPPVFESYPGEWAVIDGAPSGPDDEFYVRVVGDPVVLRLFELRNMPRAGISVRSNDHVLEGLHVHHNLLSGIHVHESYEVPSSNRNIIRDCTCNDNSGAGLDGATYADGGNSDGISISSGLQNRVENCLVYGNSDDGIDTWRSQDSYVGYSIVYSNGIASGNGQGIKAGGAAPSRGTFVEHCLSYSNLSAGFDQNSGLEVVFSHNTSWDNSRGYWSGDDTVVEYNIAGEENAFGGNGNATDNSWQRSGTVAFVSEEPGNPGFLVPVPGGGFEDLGAFAGRE